MREPPRCPELDELCVRVSPNGVSIDLPLLGNAALTTVDRAALTVVDSHVHFGGNSAWCVPSRAWSPRDS